MVLDVFIFPAPECSYTASTFAGTLIRLPSTPKKETCCTPAAGYSSCGSEGGCLGRGRRSSFEPSSLPRASNGRVVPRRQPALLIRPSSGPSKFMILSLHANAIDVGHMESEARTLAERLGCTVLLPEYPGYGLYEGKPTMPGINAAAWDAFRFAVDTMKVPPSHIVVWGRSIGTGVATHLCHRAAASGEAVKGLCLVSPYTSLISVVKDHFTCAGILFSHRWQTLKELPTIRCPFLLIHGMQDTLIKPSHSMQILETVKATSDPKIDSYVTVPKGAGAYRQLVAYQFSSRADHNRWSYESEILQPASRFISEVFGDFVGTHSNLPSFDHSPFLW